MPCSEVTLCHCPPYGWQGQSSILDGARQDGVPVLAQAHDNYVHARKEKIFSGPVALGVN